MTKNWSTLRQTYLVLKRGLEMLGATKVAVGVVTVDAADDDEGGTTTCAIWADADADHELLVPVAITELEAEVDGVAARVAVDGNALVDVELIGWLGLTDPAIERLANETRDPSGGTLLGTLKRVQSLAWSRHEFSWTVMAQPSAGKKITFYKKINLIRNKRKRAKKSKKM